MKDYSLKSLKKAFVPPKSIILATFALLSIGIFAYILCLLSVTVGCFITIIGLIFLPLIALPYIIWLGITTISNTVEGMDNIMHKINEKQKKMKNSKK
jgi:hypothetical protein